MAIIGSGMSGLTSGAYLARAGYELTIFEQWPHIGGVTATIQQDGFSWDLGPMLVEGLLPYEKLGQILSELGLSGRLNLKRDERAQSFIDFEIKSPKQYIGPEWRLNRLKEVFPEESVGLSQYYKIHNKVMKLLYLGNQIPFAKGLKASLLKLKMLATFLSVKKYKDWSAQQMMDYFFKDPKIKAVFLGILADMVVKPSEFPAFGISVFNPQTAYDKRIPYQQKGFKLPGYQYIVNGCGELVKLIAGYIESKGGNININSKVNKILIENGTVKGVVLENGQVYEADIVLASGGVQNTFYNLIGKEHLPQKLIDRIDSIRYMESVLMVHIGVDFDPREYQDKALVYYYRTYDIEEAIDLMRKGIYHEGKHGFLIYILSYHSPEMAPPGKHAITIYTVAPHELKNGNWTKQREEMAEKLLIEAEKIIPGLRDHIETHLIITPHDFMKRLNVVRHSFGGLAPKLGQENLPYQTPIKNLYFIGQFSQSGAGVFGTAAGGRELANMILGEKFGKALYLADKAH